MIYPDYALGCKSWASIFCSASCFESSKVCFRVFSETVPSAVWSFFVVTPHPLINICLQLLNGVQSILLLYLCTFFGRACFKNPATDPSLQTPSVAQRMWTRIPRRRRFGKQQALQIDQNPQQSLRHANLPPCRTLTQMPRQKYGSHCEDQQYVNH